MSSDELREFEEATYERLISEKFCMGILNGNEDIKIKKATFPIADDDAFNEWFDPDQVNDTGEEVEIRRSIQQIAFHGENMIVVYLEEEFEIEEDDEEEDDPAGMEGISDLVDED